MPDPALSWSRYGTTERNVYTRRVLSEQQFSIDIKRQVRRFNVALLSTIGAFLPLVAIGISAKSANVQGGAAAAARTVETVFFVLFLVLAICTCRVAVQNRRWVATQAQQTWSADARSRSQSPRE